MRDWTLKDEIAAYRKMCKDGLELEHFGKWIIVYEGKLRGVFDTQNEAVISAVKKFRDNAFLIKQVGATESLYRSGLPTVFGAVSSTNFEGAQCLQNLPK